MFVCWVKLLSLHHRSATDKLCTRWRILSTVNSVFDPITVGFIAALLLLLLLKVNSSRNMSSRSRLGWYRMIFKDSKVRWEKWRTDCYRYSAFQPLYYLQARERLCGRVVRAENSNFHWNVFRFLLFWTLIPSRRSDLFEVVLFRRQGMYMKHLLTLHLAER